MGYLIIFTIITLIFVIHFAVNNQILHEQIKFWKAENTHVSQKNEILKMTLLVTKEVIELQRGLIEDMERNAQYEEESQEESLPQELERQRVVLGENIP